MNWQPTPLFRQKPHHAGPMTSTIGTKEETNRPDPFRRLKTGRILEETAIVGDGITHGMGVAVRNNYLKC